MMGDSFCVALWSPPADLLTGSGGTAVTASARTPLRRGRAPVLSDAAQSSSSRYIESGGSSDLWPATAVARRERRLAETA